MTQELTAVTRRARGQLSRIFLAFFAFFGVTIVCQSLLVTLVTLLRPAWLGSPLFVWAQSSLVMYLLAFPLFFLILHGLPAIRPGRARLKVRDLLIFFAVSYAAMFLTNILGMLLNMLTDAILGSSSSAGATEIIDASPLYLIILFAVILGPIVEEAMFRGILLPRLLPFGEGFAILVSALLFGLFHGNFSQFFYAFAIGLILGFLFCRTGRLAYPILLHILLNFFGSIPPTILTRWLDRVMPEEGAEVALEPTLILPTLVSGAYGLFVALLVGLGTFLFFRVVRLVRILPAAEPIPHREWRYLPLSVGGLLYALTLILLFATSYL